MQTLINNRHCTAEEINSYKQNICQIEDLHVKWEPILTCFPSFAFEQYFDRFSGGLDGRLIAHYNKPIGSASKYIRLYDHEFNKIDEIYLALDVKDAFIYTTSNDYVVALVCKHSGLLCSIYYHGRLFSSIPIQCNDDVSNCYFLDSGMVFITRQNDVWFLPHFKDPYVYAHINAEESLSRIVAIPPQDSATGELIFYAMGYSEKIYVGTSESIKVLDLPEEVQYFALSPTNEFIAFLLNNNYILITPSDFSECYCYYDTGVEQPAASFQWLSTMILIGYENEVYLFTSQQTINSWGFEGKPLIFSDSKHALVFTNTKLYELSVIGNELVEALDLTSRSPGSVLLNSVISENLHLVDSLNDRSKLKEGIESLITAAAEITTSERMQRTFLMAATIGNGFNDTSSKEITNLAKELRLSNDLRKNLKIYMTPTSIEKLKYSPTIPMKYCDSGNHATAFEVAEFLGVEKSPIVTDWACTIIELFKEDEDAFSIIKSRICPEFDATSISIAASNIGRHELAAKIASLEPYPLKLIDFFVSIGNWDGAITAACRSIDSKKFISTCMLAMEKGATEELRNVLRRDRFVYHSFCSLTENNVVAQQLLSSITGTESYVDNSIRKIQKDLISNYSKIEPIMSASEALNRLSTALQKYNIPVFQQKMVDKFTDNIRAQEKFVETIGMENTGLPFNKAIELFVKKEDLDGALKFADRAKVGEERAQVVIARTVILGGYKDLYKRVAHNLKYAWRISAAMILIRDGKESAEKFISEIPEEKDRQSILEAYQAGLLSINELDTKSISDCIMLKKKLFSN